VAVDRPGAPPLHLHQPPGSFGLKHTRGAFELDQAVAQLLLGGHLEVFASELIQDRSQRAHTDDAI
jgi:hypothetical protein